VASRSDSLPLGEKGAEKTNPGALASGPEGTEETSTLFRKI